MKSRRLVIALLGFASVLLAAAAANAGATFRITEASSGTGWPGRAYVLTLPQQRQINPGDVSVTENGQGVDGLLVTPVEQSAPKDFGSVLAIDASTSMRGKPEAAAFAAAHAFAAERKAQQQMAVVTYNAVPTVKLPFTTDGQKIDAALATPPPYVYGTHLYDTVLASLKLLKDAHIKAGSIVLLSDGQEAPAHHETGTHATEPVAAAAARDAHVRVFTVGLRSRLSRLGALKKLAGDTGGEYAEAKTADQLARIYDQLGSKLANEYLIHYRSLAKAGVHVDVRVRVKGLQGVATTAYDTPQLLTLKPLPKAPYHPSISHRLWSSSLATVLVSILGGALIGLGTYALLAGPKKPTVRRRLAEFVSVRPERDKRTRTTTQITGRMFEGTQTALQGTGWWQKFKWELEIAQIKTPAEQIVVLTLVGSLLALMFVGIFLGHILVGLIFALAVPYAVRSLIKHDLEKKRRQFGEQLPDNLQVLSSALRAGHSFVGALSVVINDAPEPAHAEFQRVIADEQLGVPIDQALHVVAERMQNRELEQVALVAALQRESGGNTAEVLDRVTETIRERFELRRTVKTLTAQGRMSRWVLTLLPIALFSFISLINPGYMHVLYTSTFGKVMLGFAAVSCTAGSLLIKRIVNIKV
jgi:tight adherence protein B